MAKKEEEAAEKSLQLAIKARKLKEDQELKSFLEEFDRLEVEGNENTKKVIKNIKSKALKKQKAAAKNDYKDDPIDSTPLADGYAGFCAQYFCIKCAGSGCGAQYLFAPPAVPDPAFLGCI